MTQVPADAAQQKLSPKIVCLVVSFTTFKLFNPILAYQATYLVQVKGFTIFEVTNKVTPLLAYFMLVFTLLAAPTCNLFSYKTAIIISNFANLIGFLTLRFGETLFLMQLSQVFLSCGIASLAVFQAYIFFLVAPDQFQRMTGINLATVSASLFLSAELSQLLVMLGDSYNIIVDVCVGTAVCACILGFLLPKEQYKKGDGQSVLLNFFSRDQGFWSIVRQTWIGGLLKLLSIWWAATLSGFELTITYGPNLFEGISSASKFNGQVVAAGTASAAIAALCSVYLGKFVARTGAMIYIMGSIFFGALCLTVGFYRSLYIAYPGYILMATTEKLMQSLLYVQCGSLVKNAQYMLLFSFNTGMSLVTVVILQAFLELLRLDIFSQYIALGSYFLLVALIFSISYLVWFWKTNSSNTVSAIDAKAFPSDGVQSEKTALITEHVLT